eukprot:434823-Prymnesium_polylepis.1
MTREKGWHHPTVSWLSKLVQHTQEEVRERHLASFITARRLEHLKPRGSGVRARDIYTHTHTFNGYGLLMERAVALESTLWFGHVSHLPSPKIPPPRH